MNVIARLEYELAYYDSAVHRFNHYTTRTPLLHSVCDFKVARMNEQLCLIRDLILYEFELIHNAVVEATKNICCAVKRENNCLPSNCRRIFPCHVSITLVSIATLFFCGEVSASKWGDVVLINLFMEQKRDFVSSLLKYKPTWLTTHSKS